MPQGFVTLGTVPRPFNIAAGGTVSSVVRVAESITPTWSDGTIDPAWFAGTAAVSAYGGVPINTTSLVWIVVAVKATATPYLVKEADVSAIDSVLTSAGLVSPTWALLARVEGSSVDRVPQV